MSKTLRIFRLIVLCLTLSLAPLQMVYGRETTAAATGKSLSNSVVGSGKTLLAYRHRRSERTRKDQADSDSSNTDGGQINPADGGHLDPAVGDQSASSNDSQSDSSAGNQSDSSSSQGNSGAGAEGSKEEPHTLLYYAIYAIGTIIGVTILLALIGSSSVILPAIVWQIMKLCNGGKKPSIG